MKEHLCTSCKFLKTWSESHPFGSTTASEYFEECGAEAEEWKEAAENCGEISSCTSYKKRQEEFAFFE